MKKNPRFYIALWVSKAVMLLQRLLLRLPQKLPLRLQRIQQFRLLRLPILFQRMRLPS